MTGSPRATSETSPAERGAPLASDTVGDAVARGVRGRRLAVAVGTAAYLVLDVAVRAIDLPADRTLPWYPPAGIGLAIVAIAGPRYAIAIAGVRWLGALWPRRLQAPLTVLLVEAVAVAAIYALAAMVLRRRVAVDGRGWGLRDAAWMCGTVGVATGLTALAAGTQLVAWRGFPWRAFAAHVLAWWTADAIGALVLLPLALFVIAPLLVGGVRARATAPASTFAVAAAEPGAAADDAAWGAGGRAERVAQAAAVVLACAVVGEQWSEESGLFAAAGYVCFVPLTWVALRDGVRGAALVVATYSIAATLFVASLGVGAEPVHDIQQLLLTLATVGLFLGAARTAAAEGEARYWHLLASANEGVWRVDRDWRTVYVSRRFADMLGERASALVGRHVLDVVHPTSHARARARMAAAETGRSDRYEITLRRGDGTPLEVLAHASPVRSATTGTNLGAVALVTDATPLREAEAGRRLTQQVLDATFHASRDGVALVRASDAAILDVNARWCALVGRDRDALIGAPRDGGARWGGLDDGARLVAAMRAHDAPGDFETTVTPAGDAAPGDDGAPPNDAATDGGPRHVVVTASPATTDGGTYYVVSARDVTDERRAERRSAELRRLEELGRFASGVAHDFNNLLAALGGFAELVAHDVRAGRVPALDDVRDILGSVARGRDLTGRLVAFSRRRPIEARRVDPADALRDAERLLRSVLGPRVAFELRVGDELPTILADPGQLDQVLVNLATNARDAMPAGGSFVLSAETRRVTAADAGSALGDPAGGDGASGMAPAAGEYLAISARDTGVGMTAATRARIFEPFFTTKSASAGTGLGLAVVFGIVRQFGGVVHVASAPGRGATFLVLWPAAPAPEPPAPARPNAPDSPGDLLAPPGVATVLVVEDDEKVRGVCRRILTNAGFAVVEAEHGAQALGRVAEMVGRAAPPAVVLSDVRMPVLGGDELAARLAALHPDIPVVLMSGTAGEVAERAAGEHDDAAFGAPPQRDPPNVVAPLVRKPFDPASLVAVVRAAARGPQARAADPTALGAPRPDAASIRAGDTAR